MRVDNGAIGGTLPDLYTGATDKGAQSYRSSSTTPATGEDLSSLSNTSELVALAKTMTPSEHVAKLQAIKADISAGRYESSPPEVSQALVNEHLKGVQG
jgi:anti-sigma28 factor (negative regulator of flagellin synthesis)